MVLWPKKPILCISIKYFKHKKGGRLGSKLTGWVDSLRGFLCQVGHFVEKEGVGRISRQPNKSQSLLLAVHVGVNEPLESCSGSQDRYGCRPKGRRYSSFFL